MKNPILLILLIFSGILKSQTPFIVSGDTWKYLDNGSNQGTAWYGTGFNDASWSSGPSELGYGDADEATVVSFGPSSTNKYPTTYFRKVVNIPNATSFLSFALRIKRDDGVVVYVNGIEAYRDNMDPGAPAYNDYSASTCTDDGGAWLTASLNTSLFVNGNNTIAVEMHNANATSSDITFDLELSGATSTNSITRGPYLQIATQTGITVRWRTQSAENSKVKYGVSPTGLNDSVILTATTTEHIVALTGLTADTKYYYSIGSTTGVLQSGTNNYFHTLPPAGTERKYTIWATGDCGTGYTTQAEVRNEYLSYMGTNKTDAWILLGDNAYDNATDMEFQNYFFDMYTNQLKNITLWTAPGNHDYYSGSSDVQENATIPYYQNFTTPKLGQAGGVASNNAAYYSYNIGNVHMISLDSYGEESGNNKKFYDTTSAQVVWLKSDLAANTQKWVVVYFHHPPYTKGSHNSDTESDLIAIRQNFIRILERYKVDLIICGHSHNYERSKLIKGHYGNESSFNSATHNVSTSSALYDGTSNSCPYIKNGPTGNGSVYVVAGTAGKYGGTSSGWPHNAMFYSNDAHGGSFVIEVENNRMDAKWICDDGVIRDKFTIMKDVNTVSSYTITSGQSLNLTSSWIGTYNWNPNSATTASVTVNPTSSTDYYVNDQYNCLADSFHVTVTPTIGLKNAVNENELVIYPNPNNGNFTVKTNNKETAELQLINDLGELVETFKLDATNNYSKIFTDKKGNYYIVGTLNNKKVKQKIVIVK